MDKGGVGARLKARMSGSDPKIPAAPYYSFRNIYTYKGAVDGSLVPFIHANITNTDLEVIDDLTRYRIINFMYGYTYDAVSSANSNPVSKREWILGDIIHSEPKIIDYFDDSGTLTHRFIAVGANDGMLHVFTDVDRHYRRHDLSGRGRDLCFHSAGSPPQAPGVQQSGYPHLHGGRLPGSLPLQHHEDRLRHGPLCEDAGLR